MSGLAPSKTAENYYTAFANTTPQSASQRSTNAFKETTKKYKKKPCVEVLSVTPRDLSLVAQMPLSCRFKPRAVCWHRRRLSSKGGNTEGNQFTLNFGERHLWR